MAVKTYDEKFKEIIKESHKAWRWIKHLKEYQADYLNPSLSPVTAKNRWGFYPLNDPKSKHISLELLNYLDSLNGDAYNERSVWLDNPANLDLCFSGKNGKIYDPQGFSIKEPLGAPPNPISFSIQWTHPIKNILKEIKSIILNLKNMHQCPCNRPRNPKFTVRLCIGKRVSSLPRIITLEINWNLEAGKIARSIRPIIDTIRTRYDITEQRPKKWILSEIYKAKVMRNLGYSTTSIQKTFIKKEKISLLDNKFSEKEHAVRQKALRRLKKVSN